MGSSRPRDRACYSCTGRQILYPLTHQGSWQADSLWMSHLGSPFKEEIEVKLGLRGGHAQIQWTWTWISSGWWWRTGRPGVQQSMESLGWIYSDWCPYKKRTGHRQAQRDSEKAECERGHVQAKERPQKKPVVLTTWSWAQGLQNCEDTWSVPLCYGSPNRRIHVCILELCN